MKDTFVQDESIETIIQRYKSTIYGVALSYTGVQHLLHLKSKSKILQPIEIMGFFMNFFVKFKEIFCCNCCIFISDVI